MKLGVGSCVFVSFGKIKAMRPCGVEGCGQKKRQTEKECPENDVSKTNLEC